MITNFRDAIGFVSILMMIASPFAAFWNFGAALLFLLVGIIVFNIADS
jgi:hypothetical protein